MATAGRFQVKWYAGAILKEMGAAVQFEEKAAAQRIHQRLRKKIPVGTKRRRHHAVGADWQTRRPGRLRDSARVGKSKFKDGGYLVFVGGRVPYYAYWVERGTIFTYRQKFGRKGEQYMKKSVALEKARFMRNMRKRLGV
jgi:hypothetical protein